VRNHALPRIGITDFIAEVDGWTRFSQRFTHLHTGEPVRNPAALLAAILGDATNLGPKRMAEASAGVTARQVTWASLFHVRPETYSAAQAAIIDAHAAHPHTRLWGSGATSSSDGQFFQAGDRGGPLREVNARYGGDPGVVFYTNVSDQYGHYHILPISPTESEAPFVLDGLHHHETKLEIEEHFTDTGGALRHVSPQTWEHITLTGTYSWLSEPLPPHTFRPMRDPAARSSRPRSRRLMALTSCYLLAGASEQILS
jgi:hypothetical protein